MKTKYFELVFNYFQRFMPLSKEETEGILQYCEFRQFDKKTVIVQEGEVDNYLNVANGLNVVNGLMWSMG